VQNGYSVEEVLSALVSPFDRNGDGSLAYLAAAGAQQLEMTHTERRTRTDSLSSSSAPAGTRVVMEEVEAWSVETFLRASDANHDGIVTAAELHRVLRAYDPDHDGRITIVDRDRLFAQQAATMISKESRVVRIITPTLPKPAPAPTPAPGHN